MLILIPIAVVVAAIVAISNYSSQHDRVISPLLLFCAVELAAVWPGLVPQWSVNGIIQSYMPLMVAIIALFGFVVLYALAGGFAQGTTGWRGDASAPPSHVVARIRNGLVTWTALLVVIEIYKFGGAPPLLNGGLRSLIEPVANSESVSTIRETRRELTKGHLVMGEQYAGQGIINALTSSGWQTVVVVATLIATWERGRRGYVRAAIYFGIAFIFLGSAGSRSPIILSAVACTIVLSLRFRARGRNVAVAGFLTTALLLFVMPLSKGATAGQTVLERFLAATERISGGNGQNNAMIVYLVESGRLSLERGGLFVERVVAMFPGVGGAGDPFALRLTRLAYGAGSNTTGYSTPTQFGLLYADGGPLWVIFGYAVMGALCALIWKRINSIQAWYGPVVVAQVGLTLAYTSVTGIHGIPPAILMLIVALAVINIPVPRWKRGASSEVPNVPAHPLESEVAS